MSEKYKKNIQQIKEVVEGKFERKAQVGYTPVEEHRKTGDIWEDSEGIIWEQKEGFRVKRNTLPKVGIFSKVCKDCEKNCSTKSYDRETWKRMQRCYNCQTHFEEELKWNPKNRIGKKGNKWQFWVKQQQLLRWDSIDKEIEMMMMEKFDQKPFDETVANAMANSNVEMTINKNKS